MQVSIQETSSLGRSVDITIPKDQIERSFQEKLSDYSKKVHLKGFRKGRVPTSHILKHYGASIRAEVQQDLMQNAYAEALNSHQLTPVQAPQIDKVEELEEGLYFQANIEIYPQVPVATLEGVSLEKTVVSVEPKDVDAMIEKLRDQQGQYVAVQRAAKSGDRVRLSYTRTFTDEAGGEDTQKSVFVTVGNPQNLPIFNEKLEGALIDHAMTFEATYPADWVEEAARQRPARFDVMVEEVQEKTLLTLEELIARFEAADEAEFREELTQKMRREAEQFSLSQVRDTVLEKILERHTFEVPASLIANEIKTLKSEAERRQESLSEEKAQEEAEKRVRMGLLIAELVKHHELKASSERLRAAIERMAAGFPDPQMILNLYYQNQRLLQGLEQQVLVDMAAEKLVETATLQEKKMSFDAMLKNTQEEA